MRSRCEMSADTDTADGPLGTSEADRLERLAEAVERVDGCLEDGDVAGAVEAAREENEWLSATDCGLCQRLGIGMVGATMWVRAMPETTDGAQRERIAAARDSLARQYEQLLGELSEMGVADGAV
jgi:hypothetical protein